jgi:MoaA/NifB/PqqE/SkfB family radical SAM enzyme
MKLVDQITYKTKYFDTVEKLIEKIEKKIVVPYQLEVQPGRIKGNKICWMPCSYCYGGSSQNDGQRLDPDRYLDIIDQTNNGPHGNIKKIIYAGYATDPLNYEHIDDLIEKSVNYGQVIGIHSKLIKISDKLIKILNSDNIAKTSYLTVSVDGGDDKSYNLAHSLTEKVKVYNLVIDNIKKLNDASTNSKSKLDLSANYLITKVNCSRDEVFKGIENLINAGVDSIRFSFPQLPRGTDSYEGTIIPNRQEVKKIYDNIKPVIDSFKDGKTNVVLIDYDADKSISEVRTLPCFSRFIYPAISYDGYLSNCSQSAATHFKDMALGNLQTKDFWEAFYDYDEKNIFSFMQNEFKKMIKNDCRCDRKEHTVNQIFKEEIGDKLKIV